MGEEHEDITGGTKSGSETITVSILQSLNQLNTNIAAIGESLKLLHSKGETLSPKTAESARKRKFPSTRADSESEESDADRLLAESKRPKVQATRAMAPRAKTVREMTKVIPCLMKLHSRSLKRRKRPRKYQRNLPKSST